MLGEYRAPKFLNKILFFVTLFYFSKQGIFFRKKRKYLYFSNSWITSSSFGNTKFLFYFPKCKNFEIEYLLLSKQNKLIYKEGEDF